MIKINAQGNACPLPVIRAKKALKESSAIIITVDNEIATQNLTKMAVQKGLSIKVDQEAPTIYHVHIFSDENANTEVAQAQITTTQPANQYIVVINARVMGVGDETLGQALMKGFIYSLTEQDCLPTHLLCYNGGAYLTVADSEVLSELITLKERGVEILTCGACLDFYQLTKTLAVGEVTNMDYIVELMAKYHVMRP